MRSFKSNENIHKKEGGSYYVVSANKASSVTLQSPGNESQRKHILQFCEFQIGSRFKDLYKSKVNFQCFLWLSLPGDYRVTDEALLAETT